MAQERTSQHQTTEGARVGTSPTRPAKGPSGKRPAVPGRKQLAGAVALVMFGSFLPWLSTAIENVSGARGPGLWTFYVAMLGLAGALLPPRLRRWAGLQAGVMAAVCIALPVWQLVHMIDLVGFDGWMPGPGLVLVLGGGVLSGVAALRLFRA
jgi:hypothetical protein